MDAFLSILPILVLLLALAALKLAAWRAALLAFASGAAIALFWKSLGVRELAEAAAGGVATGLFPIGLVIIAALFTYAVVEQSGAGAVIRDGLASLSADRRYLALLVAWGFGNFMEGMAGFGTAVAIPCAILVGAGFDPLKAVLCCLVANTTPTAFGSVGVPTMVLAHETGLDAARLTKTIAFLQIAATSLSPFLILFVADGWRGLKEKWLLGVVADFAFLVPWLAVAAFAGCELPDVAGGLCVMLALALAGDRKSIDFRRQAWAWMPFAFVIAALAANAAMPQGRKLSPGILILAAAFAGGLCQRIKPLRLAALLTATARKYALAILTICTVLALAKTMSASGMTSAIAGAIVAATGKGYAAVSGVIGALGGFVTGSGTSSNVLFGSLQVSVATSEPEKFLFAAANIMGAGLGKMLCPQSIVLGCAAAGLSGRESEVMGRAVSYFAIVIAVASAVVVIAR